MYVCVCTRGPVGQTQKANNISFKYIMSKTHEYIYTYPSLRVEEGFITLDASPLEDPASSYGSYGNTGKQRVSSIWWTKSKRLPHLPIFHTLSQSQRSKLETVKASKITQSTLKLRKERSTFCPTVATVTVESMGVTSPCTCSRNVTSPCTCSRNVLFRKVVCPTKTYNSTARIQ